MSAVNVTYSMGDHVGGTKGYVLVAIENKKTGAGILLRVWGKVGALSSAKVEVFTEAQAKVRRGAMSAFEKNYEERSKKDYRMSVPVLVNDVPGLAELAQLLHIREAVFTNIRPSDLAEIWPDCEIPDVLSNVFPLLHARRGEQDEQVRAISEATAAARRAEEEAESAALRAAESELKSNPFFGMF